MSFVSFIVVVCSFLAISKLFSFLFTCIIMLYCICIKIPITSSFLFYTKDTKEEEVQPKVFFYLLLAVAFALFLFGFCFDYRGFCFESGRTKIMRMRKRNCDTLLCDCSGESIFLVNGNELEQTKERSMLNIVERVRFKNKANA